MTDRVLLTTLSAILDWRLPGHLLGTAALLSCAAAAVEREQKGERWTAHGIVHEYAAKRGFEQHNVWHNMRYALRMGQGPRSPRAALDEVVERGVGDGCIESRNI